MKTWKIGMLAVTAAILTACSTTAAGGTPKAEVPQAKVDFGDVPVTDNMAEAKHMKFVIKNTGTGNLQLSNMQVKTLQGC
ncbi:MAG: hypothetical protein ACM3XM_13145 [Mycobacterium leprae]